MGSRGLQPEKEGGSRGTIGGAVFSRQYCGNLSVESAIVLWQVFGYVGDYSSSTSRDLTKQRARNFWWSFIQPVLRVWCVMIRGTNM